MNSRRLLGSSLLALAAFTGTSYAALLQISVNFNGRDSGPDSDGAANSRLAVDDVAGVVPLSDWNNLGANFVGEPTGDFSNPPMNTTSSGLFAFDGVGNGTRATSSVTVNVNTNDAWNSDGGTATNNEKLMKGLVKAGNPVGTVMTITLSGLTVGTSYKFLAYNNVNNAGATGDVDVHGLADYGTYYVAEANVFDDVFTQGTSTDTNNRTAGADYEQWDTVKADASGNLTFTATYRGGGDGFGVTGFQLLELPPLSTGDVYWNKGNVPGVWDTTTPNWATDSAGVNGNATFALNNTVHFTDLVSAGARVVTVDAGGVTPGSIDVTNSAGNDYTIQGGPILGAGTLTKSGNGALTLTGLNQFSGDTTLKHGTINISSIGDPSTASNLGEGAFLTIGDTTGANDAVLNYSGNTSTVTRSLIVASNGGTFNVSVSGQSLAMNNISGTGTITKAGNGSLAFTGTLAGFSGNIAVTGGALSIRTMLPASGLISLSTGATFNLTGPGTLTDGRALFLNGNATVGVTDATGNYALTADFNDSGKVLTKSGNGRLEFAGAATFSQVPVISGGTLALTKEGGITFPAGAVNLATNQRLEIAPGALTASNPVTLSGGSLRVGNQGLQAYYFTGGFDQNAWTNAMNGSMYGIASYFAGAGNPAVSARTIIGGQTNLDFSNSNYGGNAPFASQGVGDQDNIRAIFTGKIRIDTAGATTFFTTSDDGSGLFIDGTRVVLNNNFQGATTRQGTITLSAGLHDIEIYYAEGNGGAGLLAEYQPAGGVRQTIPNSVLLSGDQVDYTASPITVTAPSTIESGAALAQMGALSLPANTLLTINGSASFTGTTLTGSSHQVAVTGFNANTTLGPITGGATTLSKTGNGNLVFTTPLPAGSTINSNAGLVVAMGSSAGGNPLAATTLNFNGGGLGLSSIPGGGDVTYSNLLTSTTNVTLAAGSFGNGNITTPTNVTYAGTSLVAPAGNTLTLRSNDGNFTLQVTPQVTGTGAVVVEEGNVNLNAGLNNLGNDFTNRIGNVTVNGNVVTNNLVQQGNLPNGTTGTNLGDNLISGSINPGSLTVTGTTNATSITTTRGTLNLNGLVTNTGALTGNGNGTMNFANSTHASATLTNNATLNANGTFNTAGLLSITGSSATFNQAATVNGVSLANSGSLTAKTTLNAGAAGINAIGGSTVRFDPGTGNTATYTGGNVVLDNSAGVVANSGITDLGNASITGVAPLVITSLVAGSPANQLFAARLNADVGLRQLNGAGAAQVFATTPTNTTTLPNSSGAANNGGIQFPGDGDPSFSAFFGGANTDTFTAYFVGSYTAKVSGVHSFRKTDGDDYSMVIADTNGNGVFDNGDTWSSSGCCGQDSTMSFNLNAGQRIEIAYLVDDSGGGSGLQGWFNEPGNGTVTGSTIVRPGDAAQAGLWSADTSNGHLATVSLQPSSELRTKSLVNIAAVTFSANSILTLSNQASSTASNVDQIKLAGANASVHLGDNGVLSVGSLTFPSGATLNVDVAPGAVTGGRLVLTGSVTGSTGLHTDINGSTLNINGGAVIVNTPLDGSGVVNVTGSGTLGGLSTISSPVNLTSSSATLSPGDPSANGGIGHLTTGQLTSSGNLAIQLKNSGAGNFDQLSVVGIVDFTTGTNLALTLDGSFSGAIGDQYPILLNDGTDGIFGQFTQGSTITVGTAQFAIHYDGDFDSSGSPNDVYLQLVVPEPGSAAILLGGFATLLGLRRIRRRA